MSDSFDLSRFIDAQAPVYAQVVEERGGDLFTGELPDDGAELRFAVETQRVVDGPDGAVVPEDAVPALAVGVVGDDVEGADGA